MVAARVGLSPILFSELTTEVASFGRRHLSPLLAQSLSPLLREGSKPLAGIANGIPLLGGQLPKTLEAIADPLLILRGELPPLLETLLRLLPLFGIHIGPLTGTVTESMLSFARQLIPSIPEFL